MPATPLSSGEVGNSTAINTRLTALNAEDAGQKARLSTLESGADAEAVARANADTTERNQRIAGDSATISTLASQIAAGDALVSATASDAVARLEQRMDDSDRMATVVSSTLPTTLAAPAVAGDTSVVVAAGGRFADKQSVVIYNRATAQVHATTVAGVPTGNTIPLTLAIPADWTGSTIGDPVGSSPPEIEQARSPLFRPDGYSGSVSERITLIERKRIYVRAFRRAANNDEGMAINMALTVAPQGYTVEAEPGEYVVPFLSRPYMLTKRKLLLDGVVLRPQVWSTTLTEAAPANQTWVKPASQFTAKPGEGICIPLTNNKFHVCWIQSYGGSDKWNIQPALPITAGAASGALVTPSWAGRGSSVPIGIIGSDDTSGWEIEGGEIDGLRTMFPHGRMFGLHLRGVRDVRIDGIHVANIASNKVDGFNNWGLQGDGACNSPSPTTGNLCRNVTYNQPIIEHCDRTGIATNGTDGLSVIGGAIRDCKPTDGSAGNLGAAVVFEADGPDIRNRGTVQGVDIEECWHGLMAVGTAAYDSGTNTYSIDQRAADVLFDNNTLRGQWGPDIFLRGFRNSATRNTISLGRSHGIVVWTARGCDVLFNKLNANYAPDSRSGIHLSGATDVRIAFNEIWRTYGNAITIDQRFSMKGLPYIENINISHNDMIDCVAPDNANAHGVIEVQTGYVNRNTDTASNSGDANAVQTTIATLTVKHNTSKDNRSGNDRVDYGMWVANTDAGDRLTWNVGENDFRGVQIDAYQGMVIKDRDLPAVTATVSFGAVANGVAVASTTVTYVGVKLGDAIRVIPITPSTPPTGYSEPQAYVTGADTIQIRYPVLSGQTGATLTNQTFRIVAVKYT